MSLAESMMRENMAHPFQCIAYMNASNCLLSACGSTLTSTSLTTGRVAAQWPAHQVEAVSSLDDNGDEGGPTTKRQKLDLNDSRSSRIIKLIKSPDDRHAVVATEDKSIRVFEVKADGGLVESSQRIMPKRPCAIQVLPDNATIVCGDKFGDVYSLPLLPTPLEDEKEVAAAPMATEPEMFKPAANNLTVHSKRNLKALESQMKQKVVPKTREPLKFKHELLLGHVSMLTDLTYASRKVDGRSRGYVITADRDEHIRISRAPPQSHVIEGYCLGHTEYVSKICAVPHQDLLVSGGGDDWLGVWDWPSFKLKKRIEGLQDIFNVSDEAKDANSPDLPIAVSGIWCVPLTVNGRVESAVVVACERNSTLTVLPVSDLITADSKVTRIITTRLESSILDLTVVEDAIVVSTDSREDGSKRLQPFKLIADTNRTTVDLRPAQEVGGMLSELNTSSMVIQDEKQTDSFLYSIANLRKRTGQGEGEDEGAEND